MKTKMLYVTLIIVLLPYSSQTDPDLGGTDEKVTGLSPSPVEESSPQSPSALCCGVAELKQLVQEQQEGKNWSGETIKLLTQLVQENKEESSVQTEILKVLRVMKETQDHQLNHLLNMARQQSLLVENHQALLFQVSRISTQLQDTSKKEQ